MLLALRSVTLAALSGPWQVVFPELLGVQRFFDAVTCIACCMRSGELERCPG